MRAGNPAGCSPGAESRRRRGFALKQLFRERLEAELSPTDLALLREASGGNPFFALELARYGAHLERRSCLRVPTVSARCSASASRGYPARSATSFSPWPWPP